MIRSDQRLGLTRWVKLSLLRVKNNLVYEKIHCVRRGLYRIPGDLNQGKPLRPEAHFSSRYPLCACIRAMDALTRFKFEIGGKVRRRYAREKLQRSSRGSVLPRHTVTLALVSCSCLSFSSTSRRHSCLRRSSSSCCVWRACAC